MATDPERVREIEDEHARRARAWRGAPERGFGDVLADAPAVGELEGEADQGRGTSAPEAVATTTDANQKESTAPMSGLKRGPQPRLSNADRRVPRDPREAILRRQLEKAQSAPRPAPRHDTPPTGKMRKPT